MDLPQQIQEVTQRDLIRPLHLPLNLEVALQARLMVALETMACRAEQSHRRAPHPLENQLLQQPNDERSMRRSLRTLKLFGPNRSKVETLRKEALKLKLKDNPIAFCFLLRSMFEISAKAYCQDHASDPTPPKSTKADGTDRTLSEVLRDVVSHLTQNGSDKQMQRLLHGPLTEIQRKDGILSLTSMNQLVHNSSFTIIPNDIPILFSISSRSLII